MENLKAKMIRQIEKVLADDETLLKLQDFHAKNFDLWHKVVDKTMFQVALTLMKKLELKKAQTAKLQARHSLVFIFNAYACRFVGCICRPNGILFHLDALS